MKNLMEWPIWIRIAVVASLFWEAGIFAFNWGKHGWIGYGGYYGFNVEGILSGSIPVALFWGGAWIVHGIKLRKKLKKVE